MVDAASDWASAPMSDEDTEDPTFGLTHPPTLDKLTWAFFRLGHALREHQSGCKQEWKTNNARLARIEAVIIGTASALIAGLATALAHYLKIF